MSLKMFHVVFIISAIIMAIGFGYWGINIFQHDGTTPYLWAGIGSLILAIGLLIYEYIFLKAHKDIR